MSASVRVAKSDLASPRQSASSYDEFIQKPLKYKIQQSQEYGRSQTDSQNHPSVLDSLASGRPAYFGKLDSDLSKEIN